jgi:sarcosine oxidase/L-pipecolate oxidase
LDSADDRLYASKGYINDVALGARTIKFGSGPGDSNSMRTAVFPDSVKTGPAFDGAFGYVNLESGWAFATRGIEMLMSRVIGLGGKVMGGKAVTGLIRPDGRTSGVMLADGSSISACLVVIASGSWTASTFRRDLLLDLDDNKQQQQFLSTG